MLAVAIGKLDGMKDACIGTAVQVATSHGHVHRLPDGTLFVTRRDPHDCRRGRLSLFAVAELVEVWRERTWPERP